jgi:hypothetical protein
MDARHAQSRPTVPAAHVGPQGWGFRSPSLREIWNQDFPKLNHFPCGFSNDAIRLERGLSGFHPPGIRLTGSHVEVIEKEKARVFADQRASSEDRTAARPVVIRDYPSRKKDPNPAVTPQTVPLTAPRLVNQEQTVQIFRPDASSVLPFRSGRSSAPGSASDLDRRIMPAAAVTRRRAHRPAGRDVLVSPLRPLAARNVLVHVRRDGGHDPSAYPKHTSRGVHPSLVEPVPTSVIRFSRSEDVSCDFSDRSGP